MLVHLVALMGRESIAYSVEESYYKAWTFSNHTESLLLFHPYSEALQMPMDSGFHYQAVANLANTSESSSVH